MLNTSDVALVLENYDLGALRYVEPSVRGFVNETAFFTTDQGRFVLRRNHRGSGLDMHHYRHQMMQRLAICDMPVPVPLAHKGGRTLLQLRNRYYEVMPFVSGEVANLHHPDAIRNAGRVLGRYHRIVADLPPPPRDATTRYSPQNLLAVNETLIERDVMGDLLDATTQYDRTAARLRHLLSPDSYRALPHVVIHGDMHLDNLLFADDEVVALLDFDQAAWDVPIADVADGLVAFASIDRMANQLTNWGVFKGPLHEMRAALFLQGYASEHRLSPAEVAALPTILEVLWLQAELGRVLSTADADPDYHLSVLQQGLDLSAWMQERREKLNQTWLAIMDGQHVTAPDEVLLAG